MEKFTYLDYLKYTKEETRICMIREKTVEYSIDNKHQIKDKGYKIILEEKEEVVNLINKVLKLEKENALQSEEIEKYNSSFITVNFKSQESDIVYKKKDEDIFFLIEHQSKVDYSMAYRILNYSLEIIRSAVDLTKIKSRAYKMPVVYPIVLYTGKQKWDAKKYFEECQLKLKGVESNLFTKYNLIDINDYTEEELWIEDNFLSKMLLLQKAKSENKIEEYLQKMEQQKLKDKEIDILEKMIYYLFSNQISQEKIEEYMSKIRKKDGGNMTAFEEYLLELVDEKIEQGIEQGKKEEREGIIIEMLKSKLDENVIKQVVNISAEELEEIKNKRSIIA